VIEAMDLGASSRTGAIALILGRLLCGQNQPPDPPAITEPSASIPLLSPHDVHMEATFSDPDPGDGHLASDWEIWTVAATQRVWSAPGATGLDKVHVHLGDGQFENSHAGWSRLFANTAFTLRVRHRDDSGDPATEWSSWSQAAFATSEADIKVPLELDDVEETPELVWTDPQGNPVDLPTGAPNPTMRLETDVGWLLLRIDARVGPGNRVTNPAGLPGHGPVRVIVDAGNTGGNLVLPETDFKAIEHGCTEFRIKLPALNLPAGQAMIFWVSAEGATYLGNSSPFVPTFQFPARGLLPPWVPRQSGYSVEVAAAGLRMPVNIAFVPTPGSLPGDPKYYVSELYGTVKVVTNGGAVLDYATGLLNYTPSGNFPGSGEQGLTGIAVDPVSGDVFASHLWRTGTQNYPRITRLSSANNGLTSSSRQVILDMPGEPQGQSHQISCLEIISGQLFCHMGDGFDSATATNLGSYRGKILRLNLDGTPVTSNPFYNGGVITSRDYVFTLGVRNPFGGAWRAADGFRYMVGNGPSIDRFARLVAGRNYGWSGNNSSMRNFALYTWEPSHGPVNLAFVQPESFAGSGFPPDKMDHAFVTESGPTYAQGQQAAGKRISEFVLDAGGALVVGPFPFVEYVGDGYATAIGLAAGPDGLYFSEFYKDENTTGPTVVGGRVLRVRFGDPDDCNANSIPDWCEVANGLAPDCNGNGDPDSCDLASGASHDFDGNGLPDECDPLFASTDRLSLSAPGQVDFVLDAGPSNAGMLYHLLGSMSGTSPGTLFGQVKLPLNTVGDPWFALTAAFASTGVLQNTLAFLDGNGRANATISTSFIPVSLLGVQLHHAYLLFDHISGRHRFASNSVPLLLTP